MNRQPLKFKSPLLLVCFFTFIISAFLSSSTYEFLSAACIFAAAMLAILASPMRFDLWLVSGWPLMIMAILVANNFRFLYFQLFPEMAVGRWYAEGKDPADILNGAFLMLLFFSLFSLGWTITSKINSLQTWADNSSNVSKHLRRAKITQHLSNRNLTINRNVRAAEVFGLLLLTLLSAVGVLVFMYIVLGGFPQLEDLISSRKRAVFVDGERSAGGIWYMIPRFSFTVCILATFLYLRRDYYVKAFFLIVILSGSLSIYLSFWTQVRGDIALLMFAVGALYIYKNGKLGKTRSIFIGIIVIFFFYVIFAIRDAGKSTSLRFSDISLEFVSGSRLLIDSIFGAFNMGGYLSITNTLNIVPEHLNYSYGESFLRFFLLPVPRSIWPEKPSAIGFQFLEAFQGTESLSLRVGGGNAPGLVSESYFAFGFMGIILFGFLFGCLLAFSCKSLILSRRSSTGFVCWFCFNLYFSYYIFGYDFSQGMIEFLFRTALPIFVFCFFRDIAKYTIFRI